MEFRYRIIVVSSYNLRANVTDDHIVCTASLCAPTELPLRCKKPYCAVMATLRRPHRALLRTPWHRQATVFVLSILKVRASMRHHGVLLLAMPLRCCGDACDRTARTSAFCIFLDAVASPIYYKRTLLWCDRGFS